MTPEQLRLIQSMSDQQAVISANELSGDHDRTLLVGTLADGMGVHIYFQDGLIHRYVWDFEHHPHRADVAWQVGPLTEALWFRPEWADFDFTRRLIERGAFLRWNAFVPSLHKDGLGRTFQARTKED